MCGTKYTYNFFTCIFISHCAKALNHAKILCFILLCSHGYCAMICMLFFYCNKPHTYSHSCTNQVHIQRCISFNIVRHPQASPCKIRSAGSPFQISAAVASQLRLNRSMWDCRPMCLPAMQILPVLQ